MSSRRWMWLALLPLAVLTQACSTYSYFDVDLKVGAGFNTVIQTSRVTHCDMFITGATSDMFVLPYGKCAAIDPGSKDIGKIRYSTFADSGQVTFQLRLFEKMETDNCELGRGETTLTISSGNTVAGELSVPLTLPGCPQ